MIKKLGFFIFRIFFVLLASIFYILMFSAAASNFANTIVTCVNDDFMGSLNIYRKIIKWDSSRYEVDWQSVPAISEDEKDSDYDGLTDKEETEIYGSDPNLSSTAGDLYSDSYKVEHNMDLFTYYEYKEEYEFPNIECEEVSIVPTKPEDFSVNIRDNTRVETIKGYKIYKTYFISLWYKGTIYIDTTKADLPTENIDLFTGNNYGKAEKCDFTIKDGVIKTQANGMYLFIVKKSIIGDFNQKLNGETIEPIMNFASANLLYLGSPLLDALYISPMRAFCNVDNQEVTTSPIQDMDAVKIETAYMETYKLNIIKSILNKYVEFFKMNNADDFKWYHILFLYFYEENIGFYQSDTGFDIKIDTFAIS